MSAPRTITVEIPACLDLPDDDEQVLRTTLETIITLVSGGCGGSDAHLRHLRENDWEVNWGLTWIARARRGSAYEEATGATKQEVLAQLDRLTGLHEVEGTP
jgi:hypothetical protein